MREQIQSWLIRFELHESLHGHVLEVMLCLPAVVREDLMLDPCFALADFEPGAPRYQVPLGMPAVGVPARAVVLKRTLRVRPLDFVRYVIAHELAHAYLRNDGRQPDEDPEQAADALAAEWGFPKPN